MVLSKTQEASDCLPKTQSKSGIPQLDCPRMVASTNTQREDVCDTVISTSSEEAISQPCLDLAESLITEENNRTSLDADAILDQEIPQEFVFPFPDPLFTLEIQGSINSDQNAQGTGSLPFSSVLSQNITTAEESGPHVMQLTSRAASSANHSDVVHEGCVQPPNTSYSGSTTVNALADTSLPMGQNSQIHFSLFCDPYEYELEKLRREEENLKKKFEETTSELKAELERKMTEAWSEYDRKSREVDDAYNAKAMEEEAKWSSVTMNSLLANAFMSKCTDATDVAAVRARSSQHSIQQQQAVQQTDTHMNSTAPPPRLSHFPRCNTTQPRPISQQAAVQSTTLTRPSVTAEARLLPHPRPPPLISNLTTSSSYVASSPPVNGAVRGPAPHLQPFRSFQAPNTAATYQRRLVQEQQQQQGNSNGGLVCLSDDEE